MIKEHIHLNNISTHENNAQGSKSCYGRICKNQGTNLLNIIYINKTGWFCDDCKNELVNLNLTEKIEKSQNGENKDV